MSQNPNIEMRAIDSITPYPNNPRHNQSAIRDVATSIRKYGFKQPIVVDKEGVIVVGHTRYEAAKELGLKTVPVLVSELSDKENREYRIADNKTNELASWDFEKLAQEVADLDFGDFDFDTSFLDEIEEALQVEIPEEDGVLSEAEEDDYDGSVPDEAISKRGEIYKLGRHRLMCGDSTCQSDVQKLMDGKLADMLLTDPPYNVNYQGGTSDHLKIANDNMGDTAFRTFLSQAFKAADAAMKPGAAFYIWHSDTEGYNFRGAVRDAGWQLRECLIWNKNSLVLGRQDYHYKHEPCLYGWKSGASHTWLSDRKQTTVIDFKKPLRADIHPTMKPIPLFEYQIHNSCVEGGIVLDLFGGSGTTIMACEQNGRTGYLMELDPRYVDAIIKRYEEFTGEKAVKLEVQK